MEPAYAQKEFYPIILVDNNKPWEAVLPLGAPVHFTMRNTITWKELASLGNGMYLVRRGMVKLSFISPTGKERTLFYIGRNTLFQEIPMLLTTRDYLFTCMEPTEAVFWPKTLLTPDFTRQYPDLVLNMLEALGIKLKILHGALCGEYSFSSFTNVCRALYSMHLFNRVKDVVVPRLAKQELASFLGMHRSSLHKALSRLRAEGVIGAYSKKKLAIHNDGILLKYT
jgi:CRP-like cAMP-binding protein